MMMTTDASGGTNWRIEKMSKYISVDWLKENSAQIYAYVKDETGEGVRPVDIEEVPYIEIEDDK